MLAVTEPCWFLNSLAWPCLGEKPEEASSRLEPVNPGEGELTCEMLGASGEEEGGGGGGVS